MLSNWLIELGKSFGRLLIHPLLYWAIILVIITGYKRIKLERKQFGFKVFDLFSEWKGTWGIAIGVGIFISFITLGMGIPFPFEMVWLLSLITIALSINGKVSMLSASYTLGFTYLLLLLASLFLTNQTYIDEEFFSNVPFAGIALLTGLLIIAESFLISRVHRNERFPTLTKSPRGVWIGQHHMKKISVIPFFTFVPSGLIEPIFNGWPQFSLAGNSYGLLIIPFILGFDYAFQSLPSENQVSVIRKSLFRLGLVVVILAIGGMYISFSSILAILLAIIGQEFIKYKHKASEQNTKPYFNQMDKGLKVFAVIPGSPADRLGILAGETIYRVNQQYVSTSNAFYEALQRSSATYKLEILDDRGEIRFVQSAFYDDDHHKLGIIFAQEPYRQPKTG